jgi:hypothetical protein
LMIKLGICPMSSPEGAASKSRSSYPSRLAVSSTWDCFSSDGSSEATLCASFSFTEGGTSRFYAKWRQVTMICIGMLTCHDRSIWTCTPVGSKCISPGWTSVSRCSGLIASRTRLDITVSFTTGDIDREQHTCKMTCALQDSILKSTVCTEQLPPLTFRRMWYLAVYLE